MVKQKKSNILYIIYDGERYYKIGITNNPLSRLKDFATSNPTDLRIVLTAYCLSEGIANAIEKKLHSFLGSSRKVKGEWFKLSSLDLQVLAIYFVNAALIDNLDMITIPKIGSEDFPGDKKTRLDMDFAKVRTEDILLRQAKMLVTEKQQASASFLQRKLRIGYARAARLLDTLEQEGLVGPQSPGNKARTVL